MKKTKMLLSCAMMLMFSVSVFAGQWQKNCSDYIISSQDEQCCQKENYCKAACCQQEKCCQQEQCCNKKEMFFMCDGNIEQEECPMFNRHYFKRDFMRKIGENCGKNFKKGFCEKMFKKLNITDTQKEALKSLKESSIKKQQELMKIIMKEWETINKELLNEKYSQKIIKKSIKNIKALSNKIIDNKITKKQSLKKILTNEQYIKMFKPKTKYDMLAERLNLSNEQKGRVTTIIEAADKTKKELVCKKFEKKKLLKEEIEKENSNKDTVVQLIEDVSNISNELFKLKIDTKIKLKDVLSFEQYNKMNNCNKRDKFSKVPSAEEEN